MSFSSPCHQRRRRWTIMSPSDGDERFAWNFHDEWILQLMPFLALIFFFFSYQGPMLFTSSWSVFSSRSHLSLQLFDEGQWKKALIESPADVAIPQCPRETDCQFSNVPHWTQTSSLQMFLSGVQQENVFLSFDMGANVQGKLTHVLQSLWFSLHNDVTFTPPPPLR